MAFIKNLKSSKALLTFVGILSSIQTVYSATILDKKCDYYCNITGDKYNGNTISKNTEGYTLRDHVKKLGTQYSYYLPCCDGKLTSRQHVDVVKNNMEILKDVNVNMKGTFDYMNTDKRCPTYCAIDINSRSAYLKDSENLTLTQFAKKYGKNYQLFTYCCENEFSKDRMTLTHDMEQFNVNVMYFTLIKSTKIEIEDDVKEEFLNTSCNYYCNLKNNRIISIKKAAKNQLIADYANEMLSSTGDTYDAFTKCCDGKMKSRSNVPVYSADGTVTVASNLKAAYTFNYMDITKTCSYYCAFKNEEKTIRFINSSKSLVNTAISNQSFYNYFTYCCNKESDVKGSVIVVKPNGEESAVDTNEFSILGNSNRLNNNGNNSNNNNSSGKKNTKTKQVVTKVVVTKTSRISKPHATTRVKNPDDDESWKCGPKYGSCKPGYCCSKYNYCGKTSEYCGVGCQPNYGLCN